MNRSKILIFLAIGLISLFSGCKKRIQPTMLEVKDPDRHYYPILQGQELDIVFQITNVGENPLFITDIQTSCGCIVLNKNTSKIVPAGESEHIRMIYNSTKNIGLVAHCIRLYGNIAPAGILELNFDVNVVPDADYTRDYEELFREYNIKNGIVTEIIDGKESERGYYIGDPGFKEE